MQVDLRRERRKFGNGTYSISWEGENGENRSVEAKGRDISSSGMCLYGTKPVPVGVAAYLQGPENAARGHCVVRHCTRKGDVYHIGLQFNEDAKKTVQVVPLEVTDYYEFLQISPKAEAATIHRVHRFMAARFHPDNPDTGDPEAFLVLNRIYEVLSDPQKRAEYDGTRTEKEAVSDPLCEVGAFVNGIDGEVNRRLAILALLYNKRRTNSRDPAISLWDLERKMAIPREYLDFATWYLKSKGYIQVADNSDFALTAAGVDYVEANADQHPMLHKLLNAGTRATMDGTNPNGTGAKQIYRLNPAMPDTRDAGDEKDNHDRGGMAGA